MVGDPGEITAGPVIGAPDGPVGWHKPAAVRAGEEVFMVPAASQARGAGCHFPTQFVRWYIGGAIGELSPKPDTISLIEVDGRLLFAAAVENVKSNELVLHTKVVDQFWSPTGHILDTVVMLSVIVSRQYEEAGYYFLVSSVLFNSSSYKDQSMPPTPLTVSAIVADSGACNNCPEGAPGLARISQTRACIGALDRR